MTTRQVLLDAFADAFNRHDLDAVMSMMTEDCVFLASAGDEVEGKRIVGQQAVREAFAAILANTPDAQWRDAEHTIGGGPSLYTLAFYRHDGGRYCGRNYRLRPVSFSR